VIEPLANALARPVTISYTTSIKKNPSATGRKLEENALARDFADTVATLMRLEETLERKLSKVTEADSSPASISWLRRRLNIVQKRSRMQRSQFRTAMLRVIDIVCRKDLGDVLLGSECPS
jgi:hypothetical protein